MSHPARPPSQLDRKLGQSQAREALVAEAWRLVSEALDGGTMTLKSGKVIALEPRDQLKHVQWLASMQKAKSSSMPLPKDIFVSPTG